ncbi:CRISPR-associated protein [Nocardiopsis sp. TSRI0078]|uniref:RAMP superfamily CRISPR-associated protein n=1 Tax=unclassified Nocardiopsis TaxID=2649073 RepID=UPI00093AF9A3|nr:RAMP superfamily CRISPR-associated protein [Nocardiopsis sp. TSRI0078]OKI19999.1 CRISPR-associated protein [Nocardiopsis sp. TSRI0078]
MSGGPRGPGLLWEISLRLRLLSDTHVGAARAAPRHTEEGDVDLRVDRDPGTGVPRLRATTLAGLLRHELAARTGDPDGVRALMGAARAGTAADRDAPATSALDVDDAPAELPGEAAVAVRTGTRVDPASGTVRPGRVWRWEILPAGTVLTAHMRLHVPAPADEVRLLTLLLLAADGLGGPRAPGPGIRVGGRTGRGYGAVRATRWAARRHDLADEDDWFAYHARTWDRRWRDGADALADAPADLATALTDGLRASGRAAAAAHLAARADRPDRRHRDELHLTLVVAERPDPTVPPARDLRPGLLMVGDDPAHERIGEADRAHRHRPAVADPDRADLHLAPVLGDTALFALFKRIGGRLARDAAEHLGAPPDRWRDWHGRWWGADTDHRGRPRPSRIRLRAIPVLTGGAPLTTTRLTVDSLFGDAVDGRLFTTDLHCGGSAEAVVDVSEPDDAVRGLLTLLVRELATVPFDTLGAGAGSGNGRLSATRARLTTRPGDGGPPRTVDLLAAVFEPEGAEAAAARGWLAALRTALAPDDGTKEASR